MTEQRLIDAHDLWTEIMMLPHNGDMISSEEVEKAIVEAPAVDAVPVVHGRWVKDGEVVVCSECGAEHAWGEYRATYCEDCGAKMDGERREGE